MSITRKILYSAAGFAAFILAAILYSFVDSRVANKPELDSPEAYGLESLEYVADPVMDLIVWQKNSLSTYDYDIPSESEFYYEKTVLPLREGEMVLSHTEDGDANYDSLTFTIEYDGKITGQYDIMKPEVLFYGGDNTKVQARWWGAENESFTEDDATFVGDKSVTISFNFPYSVINREYYKGNSDVKHDKYVEDWLKDRPVRDSFDRENFCVLQKFHDVYPDGPEEYEKVERSVTTTVLTFHAMHPTKEDVIVATADIQIKTYSEWQVDQYVEDQTRFFEEYPPRIYSEITVLSYEQSDSFSW